MLRCVWKSTLASAEPASQNQPKLTSHARQSSTAGAMSSRRKNTNPCMVCSPENQEPGADTGTHAGESSETEQPENAESVEKHAENQEMDHEEKQNGGNQNVEKPNGEQIPSEDEGEKENQSPDAVKPKAKDYRCKYCPFTTTSLADFKEHVDATHPDVILNPTYLCVACHFRTRKFESLLQHNHEAHPKDAHFKYRKLSENGTALLEQTVVGARRVPTATTNRPPAAAPRRSEPVRALSVNGTVIVGAGVMQDTSHVSPTLQRPPNLSCAPQIAVPLNAAKYDPCLDDNATLMASFDRFPYPTHAELSWLTAASKHPEEQIKVWFTTQRLKRGITWSPEEVEEARKKMFNGSIPPTHSTFMAPPTSAISRVTVRTTTVERNGASHGLKRVSDASLYGPDSKRPVMAVAPNPGDKGLMAPPPLPPPLHKLSDAKRADANDINRPVPLMQPPRNLDKNKISANVPNNSKLAVVSVPSMVFPESLTRPMIAPLPAPFKSTILVPRSPQDKAPISLPNGTLTNSAAPIPPQIRRPAVIQGVGGNLKVAPQNGQNGDANTASADRKWHQPLQDHGLWDGSDCQQKEFPLLERMKGKSSQQLKRLEENFLRNSFPTHGEVEALSAATRLSLQEVESWFGERRALRDDLEEALLSSMGNKHNGLKGAAPSLATDFSRWAFADDLSRRWFNSEPGSVVPGSELIGPQCHDLSNGRNGRAQEAELRWFNKNMSKSQHEAFRSGPSVEASGGGWI